MIAWKSSVLVCHSQSQKMRIRNSSVIIVYCAKRMAWHATLPKNHAMNIGSVIREIRLAKGLTLEDVAYNAGTDGGNLSRIERGLQRCVAELLERIATALGVSVSELYQRVEAGRVDRGEQIQKIKATYSAKPSDPLLAMHEALLTKYKKLSEPNQNLVTEFIQLLLRQQKQR